MTFILTELAENYIAMASDSAETRGEDVIEEAKKTLFFKEFNVGISTWGTAIFRGVPVNDFLVAKLSAFRNTLPVSADYRNKHLPKIVTYLVQIMNAELAIDSSIRCGFHVAGFVEHESLMRQAVFHVHNDERPDFVASPDCVPFPVGSLPYHLRNGEYKEFAMIFDGLYTYKETYIQLLQHNGAAMQPCTDALRHRAERLGRWVRLVGDCFKEACRRETVGKQTRVIIFLADGTYREFEILPDWTETQDNLVFSITP